MLMVNYELGQFVKSLAGRDSGEYFIVVMIDEQYLWLVNGKNRRLEEPKKKKKKHVQITHSVAQEIADKLNNDEKLTNAEIRRSLKEFLKED
jgi:ribosomal protein L14E/L6E/L27E